MNVINRIVITAIVLMFSQFIHAQKKSEPLEFKFENKMLRGLIETPTDSKPTAIVIIIPGYGRTGFVKENWYADLRNKFVSLGLAVCLWDKMGCGNSEGEFNPDQPVQSSAGEALAAIQELKNHSAFRSLKIGLWGLSRGGWICPLIIEKYPIDFWISASGTDDKENFGYLIKSNLLIHGKSEKDAEYLYDAWMSGHKLYCTGGSFESYLEAIKPLSQDALCRKLFGYTETAGITEASRKEYYANQKKYTASGSFDVKSGLWTYVPDFQRTLSNISCPVLAIFGENDSQVDWRKTKDLYEETIGKSAPKSLEIVILKQCNHSIQKCKTCAYMENLDESGWQACQGYYDIMSDWLKSKGVIK